MARASREQSAEQRRRRNEARELARHLEQEVHRSFERLSDPGSPPEDAAAALIGLYAVFVPPAELALALDHDVPGRAAAVARAALDASPGHPAALAFAADTAVAAEDWAGAERGYREALKAAEATGWPKGDPEARDELRARLADALIEAGRVADTLDVLFPLCREHPDFDDAQELLAEALRLAWERRELEPREACPCGSGRRHGRCCRSREEAALHRFVDRSAMYELREALREFLERPELHGLLAEAAEQWYRGSPPQEIGEPAEREDRVFVERALVTLSLEEDEDKTVLDQFAESPERPPDLAERAQEWKEHASYGLWEVADPTPAPDVALLDLVSGRHAHAAVAPEQLEGLPRWSVLLGALIPVEGIWRTGAGLFVLTPSEGRALVDRALGIAARLLPELMPRRVVGPLRRALDERRRGLESGRPVEGLEPVPSPVAHLLHQVVAGALPELRDALRELRARPMQMRNSDGEPIELISARVRVRDRLAAEDALESHPEFESTEDGWLWLGKEMDRMTRAMGEAQLAASGGAPLGEGPRRWIRAHVGVDGLDHLAVEVNSRGRFERLLEILRRAGVEPRVDSENRIDPALDLPAPGEAVPAGGAPAGLPFGAEAQAAWQKAWLDERVPALDGRTPREAAEDPAGRPLLEALLRDFEFREDASRAMGVADEGPGVAELREALGMTPALVPRRGSS